MFKRFAAIVRMWLMAVLLVHSAALGSTVIPGGNIINQTWTVTGSPYLVNGDVIVPAGSTLSIDPGVIVRFASFDGQSTGLDATRVELTIHGTLGAPGSALDPVLFEAQNGTAAATWYGIVVSAGGTAGVAHATIRHAVYGFRSAAMNSVITDASVERCTYGVYLTAGFPTTDALRLFGNSVGLYAGSSVHVALSNSAIYGNTTYGISGQSATSITLDRVRLYGNGTGLHLLNTANCSLANSLIYGGTAHGVSVQSTAVGPQTLNIVNCTIHGNASSGLDVSVSGGAPNVSLTNCIVSSNTTGVQKTGTGGSVTATYNDVWNNSSANYAGVAAGTGSISADPLYLDSDGADNVAGNADDDLQITSHSPCVDAGNDAAVTGSEDVIGDPRVMDVPDVPDTGSGSPPVVDMGAYEAIPPAADTDGDGVPNPRDQCPNTIPGASVDFFGCPPAIPGDFDRDGDVDHDDFGVFQRCHSGANVPGTPDCAAG